MPFALTITIVLSGCGPGGDDAATESPGATPTPTPPVGTLPRAPSPPPDAPQDATPAPEDQPGGAGDEEPAR